METPKAEERTATCGALKILPPLRPTFAPNRADTAERMAEITRLREERDETESLIDSPLAEPPRGLRLKRNDLNARIEALEIQGDGGPLITVTLDAYASFLVRRMMTHKEVTNLADVVNGALAFTCGEDDDHDWPEELHKAADRRESVEPARGVDSTYTPAGHAVTIRLSPVQMRMLMQVADDDGTKAAPEIIERELGEHVAHMLECFHGHDLDAARARWDREAKEVA